MTVGNSPTGIEKRIYYRRVADILAYGNEDEVKKMRANFIKNRLKLELWKDYQPQLEKPYQEMMDIWEPFFERRGKIM